MVEVDLGSGWMFVAAARRWPQRIRRTEPSCPSPFLTRTRAPCGPDDPRIDELATAMAEPFLANPARLMIVTGLQAPTEAATRYKLIAHHGKEQGSTAAQALALVETKLRAAGIRIPRPDSL